MTSNQPFLTGFPTQICGRIRRNLQDSIAARRKQLAESSISTCALQFSHILPAGFMDEASLSQRVRHYCNIVVFCHSGQSPLSHIFRVDGTRAGVSPDGDGSALPYQRVKSGGIPVRKADAAMASGAADGIGGGAAVDADAGAVQSGPEDADGVVGAGWKVVGKSSVRSPRLRTPRS